MTDATDGLFAEPEGPPSITDQIACVRRELAMRANVYPKWIESGRLKEADATRERARMQAVHDSLVRLESLDLAAAQATEPVREFVLGYVLTHTGHVMMIEKRDGTPSGRGLNGIGGNVNPGEAPLEAMRREWHEETGRLAPTELNAFKLMGDFGGRGFRVHVFAAGPMDAWPEKHGGPEESGLIVCSLAAMLRRSDTAHHGPGMPTAMPLCPWVPMTLAMCFLERQPIPNHEPRITVFA